MVCRCWRYVLCLICLIITSPLLPARANDGEFPFDRELILDAAPMRGSKRIPIIEVAENGVASIQLWCTSLRGQANVGADSISIIAGPPALAQCAPERHAGDENLLAALAQVTNWRRRGDVVELVGATTLRFRLITN